MPKSRYLAAVLSFVFAGLGQLYVGSYQKAAAFLLLDAMTSYLYLTSESGVILLLNFIITVASMVDAYNTAKKTEVVSEKPVEEQRIQIKAY